LPEGIELHPDEPDSPLLEKVLGAPQYGEIEPLRIDLQDVDAGQIIAVA